MSLTFAVCLAVLNSGFCAHTQSNDSDVIITYAGHAEAYGNNVADVPVTAKDTIVTASAENHEKRITEGVEEPIPEPAEPAEVFEEDNDEVIFVPNEGVRQSDDEGFLESERNVGDLFGSSRTLNDVMSRRKGLHEYTEPPGVVFVTGKNNQLENIDDTNFRRSDNGEMHREAGLMQAKVPEQVKKVDCARLDCNRTRAAVCGGKVDGHTRRYRLFLNECFLEKVNCGFKFDINKYTKVSTDRCKKVGAHAPISKRRNEYVFNPRPPPVVEPQKESVASAGGNLEARRAYSTRRSHNMEVSGASCGHVCPLNCPTEYAPECAVSSLGHRRVFLNHCMMDLDSCTKDAVWQQRHLAECIGHHQADLRQNRAFVGWMQRIGIIDSKGRFVHE